MSDKGRGLLISALLSLIVAAVTAWLTAYWSASLTEVFRTKSHVALSAGGLVDNLPEAKISLKSADLVTLDDMTAKDSPDEIQKVITKMMALQAKFADMLQESDSQKASNSPLSTLVAAQTLMGENQQAVSVPLSAAKTLVTYIEKSPSTEYKNYKTGRSTINLRKTGKLRCHKF
jgi:hypothetical protein